jgi:hypothetical protein
MMLEADGISCGLEVDSPPVPAWLENDFLRGRQLSVDEDQGIARVVGPAVEGTLRLSDGLPIAWSRHASGSRRAAAAAVASPKLTPSEWQALIQEQCADRDPSDLKLSAQNLSMSLARLIGAAIRHGDELIAADSRDDPRAAEAKRVIDEIVTVELGQRPPDVESGETAMDYVLSRFRPHVAAHRLAAKRRGWTPSQTQWFLKLLTDTMGIRAIEAGAVDDRPSTSFPLPPEKDD